MNITTSDEIIAKSRAVDGVDGCGGSVGVCDRVLTCVGCRSTITDQYILQVSPDLEWHVDCLRCHECHQPLDEQKTCFVRNGKTYCKADYLRLFGIKCVGCRLGFKMTDLVMRTRHRIFHLDCFRCSICRRRLIPGDEYALDDDLDPVALYCRHDYDAISSSSPSSSSAGLPPPSLMTQDTLLTRGAEGSGPLSPNNNNDDRATTTNDDVTSDNNNDHKTTTNENCLSSSPHHNTSTTSNSSNSNSASGPGGGGGTGMMMLKSTVTVALVGKRGGGGGGGTGGSRSGGGSVGGGGGRTIHTKSSDHHPKTTRVRTVLNEKQLHTLRTCYAANPRPDALMKDQLVEMTGLSSRVIRVWFQNKRCKDKKRTILIKQIQQQQQQHQHNDKLHGGGIPLIATSPVQHDPSSSMIQATPVEIHRFIHHHSTSSSWNNSISSTVASSLATAAAAADGGGGGVAGGPPYDPINQPSLQISTSDARDHGQGQAPLSQGQGHVMASFQQLLNSFGESDDDDTVVSLEETSAVAAGLQGPLTAGLHPPPPLLPPISIGGGGTQPPASASASASVALASRVAMQRIARFSNNLHLHHTSRLSNHHQHHHHPHQHQQHHQHISSQTPPPPPILPPHLFNNASITNNSSSSSSNFISSATHLIQQSTLKAFDTKC